MKSRTTENFRKCFAKLPKEVRDEARKAYRLWRDNPSHPSLQFKEVPINKNKSLWSVRTGLGYRALGMRPHADEIVWHWIGTHAEYDGLIEARRAKRQTKPD